MKGENEVLRGNWATLLLPIAADQSIDFGRLAEEIDLLIAARVDGIYSNGTAGELHNQTEAEYAAIQALLAERCRAAGMPFVIGACQPDPSLARQRVTLARDLGPAAIQVVLPDWWPVTEPEALDFLQLMAEAADGVPLILYNPPHAKRVLAPDELGRLVRAVPAVVGIKLADGDDAWYAAARQHLSGTALFVPGHHLATGMRHGVAAGAFSNVACLSPAGAQAWTDRMAADIEGALDLERRICRFMDQHVVPFRALHGYSNAALDKLLAAVGGWGPVGPRLRRPYRWIDEVEALRLRPVARSMMPELFLA
ncbi:MAG: dihydrodipicolinate synthase family protein [Inquilinus sp.]|uniref:dihydrodipicolinate synthase family protein n=1 Tax=Inquilinus sp. TaxID=1932117 RepID=UPI003F3116C7